MPRTFGTVDKRETKCAWPKATRHIKQNGWFQLRQPGGLVAKSTQLKVHGFASPPLDGFAIIGLDVVNVRLVTSYHAPFQPCLLTIIRDFSDKYHLERGSQSLREASL